MPTSVATWREVSAPWTHLTTLAPLLTSNFTGRDSLKLLYWTELVSIECFGTNRDANLGAEADSNKRSSRTSMFEIEIRSIPLTKPAYHWEFTTQIYGFALRITLLLLAFICVYLQNKQTNWCVFLKIGGERINYANENSNDRIAILLFRLSIRK